MLNCGTSAPLLAIYCWQQLNFQTMSKKTLEIEVTIKYTVEVDTENSIVKEYETEKELVDDLASYRFSVLPVIGNGVEIKDVEVLEWSY